jgi:homoserine acetyltransferase
MSTKKENTTTPQYLVDFHKLSNDILLYRPSHAANTEPGIIINPEPNATTSQLTLIVLCTWVGAKPKHITKYTDRYRKTHPGAGILIVKSSLADMTYRSDKAQSTRLKLALKVILSHTETDREVNELNKNSTKNNNINGSHHAQSLSNPKGNNILFQAFSNGGAQSLAQLLRCLKLSTPSPPIQSLILDSCPGAESYTRSANAMVLSLPKSNPLVRLLGYVLIHIVLSLIYILDRWFGYENVVSKMRKRLIDSDLVAVDVPRLYLYSTVDEMVPYDEVERHAEDARKKGVELVESVRFENSGHCAHIGMYGEQYWSAVRKVSGAKL